MLNRSVFVWVLGWVFIGFLSGGFGVEKFIAPLLIVSSFAFLTKNYRISHVQYLLFFSISLTSLFGFTETLTGSHAVSSNVLLYGLSFYSASMAYLIVKNDFGYHSVMPVTNPLLLITGPIALYFKRITHRNLKSRIEYYVPFIIVGSFMFIVVGSPLTQFFFLIEKTDVISSLAFAAIFELFIYANFCGLSLLIYGVFGVMGYRIPLNFKQPFSSRSIIEFWKGWHTSLSRVLRVLFYDPVRKKYSLFSALFVVYISSAMWHGVTFNFLIWGVFHALSFWLTIEFLKHKNSLIPLILLPFIVIVGRLIFAESDTTKLLEKLTFSFDGFGVTSTITSAPTHSLVSLVFGTLIIACEFIFKNSKVMRKRNYKFLRTPVSLLALCFIGILFASDVGTGYAVYGQR